MNVYRAFGALVFDEVCRRSHLTGAALVRHLRAELKRSTLSRQTLAAWRAGDQDVPAAAIYAIALLVPMSPAEAANSVALRMLERPSPTYQEVRKLVVGMYNVTDEDGASAAKRR